MKKLFYLPSAQRRSAVMQVAKRILPILFGLKLEALKALSQNFKQSVAPARVRLSPARNLSTPQFNSRRKVSVLNQSFRFPPESSSCNLRLSYIACWVQ